MSSERKLFGTELRRRRTEAGLSLAGLAKLVHYSKSHLSKVETGVKPPSPDLARQCDSVLSCGGALSRLAVPPTGPSGAGPVPPTREPGRAAGPIRDRDEVWVLSLRTEGDDQFGVVSRRQLLAGGAGLVVLPALDTTAPVRRSYPPGDEAVASFRAMFDQLRHTGQHVSASVLAPVLVTQTHALQRLAAGSGAAHRDAVLRLASRFAEYTGWLAQEEGNDERALWWTDRAVEMASAGGDPDLAAYAFVRRSLMTLYRNDAAETVALARHARSATSNPRIRGLAAQREAQGHALAGDYSACLRALEESASLLAAARAADPDGAPTIGTSHVADPATFAEGWCLVDLGKPERAVEVLDRALAQIPEGASRARARHGARLALAYANSGEPEQACLTVAPVLASYERIGSATILADLRSLARALYRWRGRDLVRDTLLRLTSVLSTAAW
jgi:transcriptional regulator with XRE-family HTH domain/tetratricopeptide (TPR) repeat protein